ncbi:MarR family transcriptional regulator [Cardiobacteriaceae bacterium TAE3-ERU3]|nr:MarR family transcriptional regulator [Cardiobacteriaceae bacterium TAE3-ERU3]
MKLNTVSEQFVLHWGEMGSRWGVNRSVAQIHALLYIVARPMHAEEITETLGIARSNVSNSLKELREMRLVQVVHQIGDRRDYFTTSGDVWALFRVIVEERQRREIEPTERFLRELMASPEFELENDTARKRIRETHDLLATLTAWTEQMLKLSNSTMQKLLKLGSSIKKLLK